MEIRNGTVFTEKGEFSQETVYTDGERFSHAPSGETLDARGLYVLPGLVDIHIHGYAGADFCDGCLLYTSIVRTRITSVWISGSRFPSYSGSLYTT